MREDLPDQVKDKAQPWPGCCTAEAARVWVSVSQADVKAIAALLRSLSTVISGVCTIPGYMCVNILHTMGKVHVKFVLSLQSLTLGGRMALHISSSRYLGSGGRLVATAIC